MKIAIIGTGIAGNVVANRLAREHEITVFEANGYVGGHTNTVDVEEGDRTFAVDTGFIVFNDRTYPNFIALLEEIGQPARKSGMSFSVQNPAIGLEYNGSSLNGLFAQRRNLLKPRFIRMIRDILRFNEQATELASETPDDRTIGDYLEEEGYSPAFRRDYLVPMMAAIWSAEPAQALDMPLGFLVRFFHNHGLLQLKDRPQWYTIEGGSREYVKKLVAGHRDRIRLNAQVQSVSRMGDHVQVKAAGAPPESFDHVFIACHSDQAMALLADPTAAEREVLGAIPYQSNEAVLHTDVSLLPERQRAWAAWNYHLPRGAHDLVSVTYNMNMLQGLDARRQYSVTLNNTAAIDPSKVLYTVEYEHPVFNLDSVAAQARQKELNTGNMTSYCGAYWRNGFHEDGVFSAMEALKHFNEELQRAELHIRRAG